MILLVCFLQLIRKFFVIHIYLGFTFRFNMKETAWYVGPEAVKYIVSHAVVQVIFCVPETLNVVSICEIFHNIAYPFRSFV